MDSQANLFRFLDQSEHSSIIDSAVSPLADEAKKCEICYKILKKTKRFCSRKCYLEHHKAKTFINCKNCNTLFKTKPNEVQKGKKYCSWKCFLIEKRKESEYHSFCIICNTQFSQPKHLMRYRPQKFCSHTCYYNSIKNTIIKKCVLCKQDFRCVPSSNQNFCSKKCGYIGRTGVVKEINRLKREIILKNLICKNCGKIKKVIPSIHKIRIFCSYKCSVIYRKDHPSIIQRDKQRKFRLNQIFPSKDTTTEVKFQYHLNKENIKFLTHFPILCQPDIFIYPSICIFIDGCYWHSCPLCQLPKTSYIINTTYRDKYVTRMLKIEGYIVLRFWEHEVEEQIKRCIDKVKCAITFNYFTTAPCGPEQVHCL